MSKGVKRVFKNMKRHNTKRIYKTTRQFNKLFKNKNRKQVSNYLYSDNIIGFGMRDCYTLAKPIANHKKLTLSPSPAEESIVH